MRRATAVAALAAAGFIAGCHGGGGGGGSTGPTFSVGGSVSGVTGSGMVLQLNGGGNLSVTADGPFTFATQVAQGGTYNVVVFAPPTGQSCTVVNGSGT